jgi:5-methylcytosine-specific restriction protein B
MDKAYIIKVTNENVVKTIFEKNNFVHEGINIFYNEIKKGDQIFIYLGGDQNIVFWKSGLIGCGEVISEPHDLGYDNKNARNYKIGIKPFIILDEALPPKVTKLHKKYQDLFYDNAPYIGANHFPTQAIQKISDKKTIGAIYELLKGKKSINYYSKKHLIKSFVQWFNDNNNFKLSYEGLVNEKILDSWDSIFFNNKLFSISSKNLSEHIEIVSKMLKNLEQDVSWIKFNESTSKGSPKAILGERNYLKFLHEYSTSCLKSLDIKNTSFDCDDLVRNLDVIGLKFKHEIVNRVAASLLTKSFLIITGNSGTGKTKIAEYLSRWLCGRGSTATANVAVGADWTDNRAVVGFVNHLRSAQIAGESEEKNRNVYQSTSILDLILSADEDKDTPHFLILDEMNLSHVERYFSDFLSAMESKNGVIRLHQEGKRDFSDYRLPRFDGDPIGVPREIAYPPNLFVIGTVNIDETTYMFSPKVLDRAHVIEFQVEPDQIADFLNEPNEMGDISESGETTAMEFLQLALNAREGRLESFEGNEKVLINMHLLNLLLILKRGRFEFAYRTANEVTRYLRVCRHLAEDKDAWSEEGWKKSLDDEILQKILPRLHGSRNRLGPLLGALACYLHTGDREAAEKYFPTEGVELASKSILDAEFRDMVKASALFPRSFAKIKMMSEVLIEEQFVSFIC